MKFIGYILLAGAAFCEFYCYSTDECRQHSITQSVIDAWDEMTGE